MKKYLVVPGTVISKTDRQQHYISSEDLMRLYGVHPRECQVWLRGEPKPKNTDDLLMLFPRYHGDYTLDKAVVSIEKEQARKRLVTVIANRGRS